MERLQDLGTCCGCGKAQPIMSIILLPWKNDLRRHGWACLVCGLKPEGAMVVLCEECTRKVEKGQRVEEVAQWECRGYPTSDGRRPLFPLDDGHAHDMSKHPGEG